MKKVLAAGTAYFAVIFALAFGLGAIRVGLLAPAVGEVWATAIEIPIVLTASWVISAPVMRRVRISGRGEALAMGAVAFALLMTAEAALAVLAFGQSPGQFLAGLITPAGALGLAGQIAFGLIPLARRTLLP